ncbi:fumarylacetoacetase [Cladophialophora psammophila CBS 110553]|uniref:Fumarylacetoacetase n=1 Tax=Cladophialophora psammophila CBS 110553 TaxID=1182543 RepID=W9WWJ3_9EURO|nr:fumarylacetoacetase [Cladophialophora psammophila CBS 110553]EXJ69400.1 fumarylacetoacetase [Cladophialophora psammophila CBS 110553]
MDTWVEDHHQSGFSVQNLPYGIFSAPERDRRIGVAIGRHILDLKVLAEKGTFAALDIDKTTLEEQTLNRYAALGQGVHRKVRAFLQSILRADTSLGRFLRDDAALKKEALVPRQKAEMHLPFDIGDYTDFFTSPYHAQNVGALRPRPLPGTQPPESMYNMPLGYHGRSSSVVVSGTPVRRPRGQFLVNEAPAFGPSQKLDFEVEFAAFIGKGNEHGIAIPVVEAEEHIFGVVLMNDWSARDIQSTEATPLGPFNGKNFCTTISPWVVPLDALELLRTKPVPSHTSLLPYLQEARKDTVYDIPIDVFLELDSQEYHLVQGNTKNILFSFAQMIAHHTAGGCPLKSGDLIGTGTLSGSTPSELGCLLEATRNGSQPLEGSTLDVHKRKISRAWLEDGDVIKFRVGNTGSNGRHVDFGCCEGKVVPQP